MTGKTRHVRWAHTLDVTISGNAIATVRVPMPGESAGARDSPDDLDQWNQVGQNYPGIERVEREGDTVAIEVGPGDYAFELEQVGHAHK